MSNNYKVIKGSEVRGDNLHLLRAKRIYVAAAMHPHVDVLSCRRNHKEMEILILRFNGIAVPDEPDYNIHVSEEVAVCCSKEDLINPEVYALRNDFPLGLPHSNAQNFERPVSLCVSDVPLADIRIQWNACKFLNSIFRWFNLNCLGQLHEKDRPLEVFFQYHKVCYLLNFNNGELGYCKYTSIDETSSTLKFVKESEGNCILLWIAVSKTISSAFACLPKCINDLNRVQVFKGTRLSDIMLGFILKEAQRGKRFEPVFILSIPLVRNKYRNKEERYDVAFVRIGEHMHDVAQKRKDWSKEHFDEWFLGHPVDVEFISPPITNKINTKQNGINNQISKIVVIGFGTLGSNLVDKLVREGSCKEMTIIDPDVFQPHNFSRHILNSEYVGINKAVAARKLYSGVEGLKIRTASRDYLSLSEKEKSNIFNEADLIIDASTSVAVERQLAFDDNLRKIRKCSVFLNPKGTDLVLLFEDKDRINRLDLLEMEYYMKLLADDALAGHLEVADNRNVDIFSCRSVSNIINYDNVGILSSIASLQIKKTIVSENCKAAIWHVNQDDGTNVKYDIDVISWIEKESNGFKVFYNSMLLSELVSQRELVGNKETGGCLFGNLDRERNIFYILFSTHAPEDSDSGANYFIRGTKFLANTISKIERRTYYQVEYLGEWHSHPDFSCRPSKTDDRQLEEMRKLLQGEDHPFVQMITGEDGIFVRAIM